MQKNLFKRSLKDKGVNMPRYIELGTNVAKLI